MSTGKKWRDAEAGTEGEEAEIASLIPPGHVLVEAYTAADAVRSRVCTRSHVKVKLIKRETWQS